MTTSVDAEPRRHWLIARRLRDYPFLMLGVIACMLPIYALTFKNGLDPRGLPAGSDFIAFWSAGQMSVDGNGVGAYDLTTLAAVQAAAFPGMPDPVAFVHPPFFLLVVTPLGLLPYGAALLLWTVAGLGAFFVALRPLLTSRRAWWLAIAFPGVWLGLLQGQTQFIVAALLGGALVLLPRRPVLAGVLIGLLAMKPHLAVLVPLALISGREWRAFGAAAVTAVLSSLAGVLVFGRDSLTAWFDGMDLIRRALDAGALPVHKFVTPYSSLRLLGLEETPALVLHGIVAVVAAVVVAVIWRRTTNAALRGAALVSGTFLVVPYAADYDLALLAFPIAWLAAEGMRAGWRRGDRNLLVLAWLLPVLTSPVAILVHLSPTPFVMAALLRIVWLRAGTDSVQVASRT